MTLAAVLLSASQALERQAITYALVGGLAVSARTEPRFTRDVDLAVGVADDGEAERCVHSLVKAGFGIETAIEQSATRRLATVRMRPPGEPGSIVDLLFASSGIEPELVGRAEPIEVLPDVTIPVATTGDLIALKLLARDDEDRPQDAVDLLALARVAGPDDWTVARRSCEEIAARGFSRGRDLVAELATLEKPR